MRKKETKRPTKDSPSSSKPNANIPEPEQVLKFIEKKSEHKPKISDLIREFNIRKNQDQEGDDQRTDAQHPLLAAEKPDRDDADQGGGGGIHQVVEQKDDAEQFVGVLQQIEGQAGAP